jgi:hypothetical protein
MSFEIKPEDVPMNLLLVSGRVQTRQYSNGLFDVEESRIDKATLAYIANWLINQGVVSPPVYVIRDRFNQEIMEDPVSDRPHVYSLFNHNDPSEHEHWKGQTE